MSENKKLEEQLEDKDVAIGVCRFCGQTKALGTNGNLDQRILDERVTDLCDCSEAKAYRDKIERKENAKNLIRTMLGDQFAASARILMYALDAMVEGEFVSITIDVGEGVKAKVGITSKGMIKVTVNESKQKSWET